MSKHKSLIELEKTIKNSHESEGFKVSGISMQYLEICKRELWFYLKGVEIEKDNPHIQIGEHVDKNTFIEKENFGILDGMISPDFTDDNTLVEVKPSSSITNGAKSQLEYYMWYLRYFYNEELDGILAIPSEKKRISIDYTQETEEKVLSRIQQIYELFNSESPPPLEKKQICDSCAYQDFCWMTGDTHE